MRELEKILEEIEHQERICLEIDNSDEFNAGAIDMAISIKDIIRKHMNDGWIPVEERLPENDGIYITTMDGEIVGQKIPFTGLAEFENGKWVDDEDDYNCVIAWRNLPEPYKPKQQETCKYTGGSCCWPIDQCGECPNNPERSENDQ